MDTAQAQTTTIEECYYGTVTETEVEEGYLGTFVDKVNSTFGLTSSGTKSFKKEITLSGPASPYNSRDFYYKKGRHTHKVRTVEKLRNKNGTIISSKTHIGYLGVPAIKNYSVDTK